MPLSCSVEDREFNKFTTDSNGDTCVRTCGEFDALPAGLNTGGKITEVTLNSSTWVALPATALTGRNGMGIQNPNGIEIKLNFDNAQAGYVGWIVRPNGETFMDIKEGVVIYAKAQSGTPIVVIMEVA